MFIPLEFKLFGSGTNGVIKGFQMTMELYESLGQRQAENQQTQLRWVDTLGRIHKNEQLLDLGSNWAFTWI